MKKHIFLCISLIANQTLAVTYTVTTTADSGVGSLRDAIDTVNLGLADRIEFAIPPFDGTVKTIAPLTDLPAIFNPVFIDGYSQPGSQKNTLPDDDNAIILIELRGGGFVDPNVSFGLFLFADNCVVQGLILNNWLGDNNNTGFALIGVTANSRIVGNFVGLTADGLDVFPNQNGITIFGPSNIVGSPALEDRNVVAGATMFGLGILLADVNNVVQNNFIGTDRSGRVSLDNDLGIFLAAPFNTVGGFGPFERNVVRGGLWGIQENFAPGFNQILGNYIGVDVTGTEALADNGIGIEISTGPQNELIQGNVISGNVHGIVLGLERGNNFDFVTNCTIIDNLIGTDFTGTKAIPNSRNGIMLTITENNLIDNNTISGNGINGIYMLQLCNGNTITNNFIGTDINGRVALPNGRNGIQMGTSMAQNNQNTTVQNNLISGNVFNGISIKSSSFNLVQANKIGVDVNAQNGLPNGGAGVSIACSSNENTIGI